MTRREDPVWGDLRTARMANDDTFYMTNCATQHERFNSGIWLSLENAMLDAARSGNGVKISVFSGPVLLADDPEVLGVQVPTAFWKIVAWIEDGALHARGYVQSQRTLVNEILRMERRRLEALPELARVEPYEVAIADIARTTSLDFGVLVAADEKMAGGPESRRGTRLTQASVDSLAQSLSRASRSDDNEDDEYRRDGHRGLRDDDPDRLRQLIADVVKYKDRLFELLEDR